MIFELTSRKCLGLSACGASILIFLIVVFTAPSTSILGIFLQGLLIILGATGYGALLFGCALAIGLLGIGLGLLIDYTIQCLKNTSEKSADSRLIEMEKAMEEDQPLDFTEANTPTPLLFEKDDFKEIIKFEKWCMEIANLLYEETLKGNKETQTIFQEKSQVLLKKYKALAFEYHPDKEPDNSKKASKTKAFQELGNVFEKTLKTWELALLGIAPQSTEMTESNTQKGYGVTPVSKEEYQLWLQMVREEVRKFHADNCKTFKAELIAEIRTELQETNTLFWVSRKGMEIINGVGAKVNGISESVSNTYKKYIKW